jgi:hypothetical protein
MSALPDKIDIGIEGGFYLESTHSSVYTCLVRGVRIFCWTGLHSEGGNYAHLVEAKPPEFEQEPGLYHEWMTSASDVRKTIMERQDPFTLQMLIYALVDEFLERYPDTSKKKPLATVEEP